MVLSTISFLLFTQVQRIWDKCHQYYLGSGTEQGEFIVSTQDKISRIHKKKKKKKTKSVQDTNLKSVL